MSWWQRVSLFVAGVAAVVGSHFTLALCRECSIQSYVNVGGAILPTLLAFYLLARTGAWLETFGATLSVVIVTHLMARSVPGMGVLLPVMVPLLATALAAAVFSRRHTAAVAYISGTLGVLIGADILDVNGAPFAAGTVAITGGEGIADAVFLTGLVGALLAPMVATLIEAFWSSKKAC